MTHKVDKSLQPLMVDIQTLIPLDKNPRRGNVDSIAASYQEFGQLKPIVVRPNSDGTKTVLAGNHQLEAAKRLGWTHIACVEFNVDDSRAVAFALADNRTNELGYSDPSLLADLIHEISDEYEDLLDSLAWDAFEVASIEEQAYASDKSDGEYGFVPPTLISMPQEQAIAVEQTEEGPRIVPAVQADSRQIATTGSTLIGASGVKNAIVQYSLVFDSVEQQSKWYSFIRWLKNEPSVDGDTTAERLINFIDAHADY